MLRPMGDEVGALRDQKERQVNQDTEEHSQAIITPNDEASLPAIGKNSEYDL